MPNKPVQRWLPRQRPTTIPLYYAGESGVIGSILIARSFAKWLRKKHWAQYWRAGETLSWETDDPDDLDGYYYEELDRPVYYLECGVDLTEAYEQYLQEALHAR